LVNAAARRLNGGGSWVCGGPCLVNVVARRLNGGFSWVGELFGVADVIKGLVRLEKTSHSSMGWCRSMFGECGS
jgi:hypothetical protein